MSSTIIFLSSALVKVHELNRTDSQSKLTRTTFREIEPGRYGFSKSKPTPTHIILMIIDHQKGISSVDLIHL